MRIPGFSSGTPTSRRDSGGAVRTIWALCQFGWPRDSHSGSLLQSGNTWLISGERKGAGLFASQRRKSQHRDTERVLRTGGIQERTPLQELRGGPLGSGIHLSSDHVERKEDREGTCCPKSTALLASQPGLAWPAPWVEPKLPSVSTGQRGAQG